MIKKKFWILLDYRLFPWEIFPITVFIGFFSWKKPKIVDYCFKYDLWLRSRLKPHKNSLFFLQRAFVSNADLSKPWQKSDLKFTHMILTAAVSWVDCCRHPGHLEEVEEDPHCSRIGWTSPGLTTGMSLLAFTSLTAGQRGS